MHLLIESRNANLNFQFGQLFLYVWEHVHYVSNEILKYFVTKHFIWRDTVM